MIYELDLRFSLFSKKEVKLMENEDLFDDMKEIEIDCAKCENDKIKHKAEVLSRKEGGNKIIIEFICKDCGSRGTLTFYKKSKTELLEYPPD